MYLSRTAIIAILCLLQACGRSVAPVQQRDVVREQVPSTTERSIALQRSRDRANLNSGYHVVEKGDTLYSIAFRYSKDFKAVAQWNRISPPYTIYPGQFVRLKPAADQRTAGTPAKKKGTPLQTETVKTPFQKQNCYHSPETEARNETGNKARNETGSHKAACKETVAGRRSEMVLAYSW